jgi:hypothetical protein
MVSDLFPFKVSSLCTYIDTTVVASLLIVDVVILAPVLDAVALVMVVVFVAVPLHVATVPLLPPKAFAKLCKVTIFSSV